MSKNSNPLFSIIITSYNIEKYIIDCIDSIKAQTFTDYECIIIDDGSTDNTTETIRKTIADDDRFRLVEISHSGPAVAKNTGLKEAVGKYVMFPDGDDTLSHDCLEILATKVNEYDVVIFGINFIEYDDNVIKNENSIVLKEMEFNSGSELADWYIVNHKLLLYSVANKCYRTSALTDANILFREKYDFGEDRLFNYDFLPFCRKIKTISDVFYNYRRINQTSVTKSLRHHHIDDLIKLHEKKMECMLNLSSKTSEKEKDDYKKYDILNTALLAFSHITEHKAELSDEEFDEELDYLSSINLPNYFYVNSKPTKEKLIPYINSIVFSNDEDIDTSNIDTIVVLGSPACKYRIERAYNLFGNKDYICCGGNFSSYQNSNGKRILEADYMQNFLLEHEVNNIKLDKTSKNTLENIINASSMINADSKVVVVTGGFHKKRVEYILRDRNLDWTVISAHGPNTQPENWYKNLIGIETIIREYEWFI